MLHLLIEVNHPNPKVKQHYVEFKRTHATDSGLDLFTPETIKVPPRSRGFEINLAIKCQPVYTDNQPRGYYLFPRSSLSKTPLRVSNSVGIIDETYRGDIKAKVDNVSENEYEIKEGDKLFQLCASDLKPFTHEWVPKVSETARGAGGFGSTDLKTQTDKSTEVKEPKSETKESEPQLASLVPTGESKREFNPMQDGDFAAVVHQHFLWVSNMDPADQKTFETIMTASVKLVNKYSNLAEMVVSMGNLYMFLIQMFEKPSEESDKQS